MLRSKQNADWIFVKALARAFGGAILFSFPMLMTMEMWSLGFSIDPFRLILLLLVNMPLLIGLSYYEGFEESKHWKEDVRNTLIAYAVGFIAASLILAILAILRKGMSANELIGKVALQAVPGSIGAMLARKQFEHESRNEEKKRRAGYGGAIFLLAVGALFLCMSLASTEEMVLIAYKMTAWHLLVLTLLCLILMQAFLTAVAFHGGAVDHPVSGSIISVFFRFTIVGYAIAFLISGYILWTFGRTDGMAVHEITKSMIVLGFPASLGAGVSRMIL
jgi:putative integral membrane protein (TIGR02587 family)